MLNYFTLPITGIHSKFYDCTALREGETMPKTLNSLAGSLDISAFMQIGRFHLLYYRIVKLNYKKLLF